MTSLRQWVVNKHYSLPLFTLLLGVMFSNMYLVEAGLKVNNGWIECSLSSNSSFTPYLQAGCKTFDSISPHIFVKRIEGAQAGYNQLWLMAGGPGYSGTFYEKIVEYLMSELDYKYTIYIMDHRGTGRSSNLQCSTNNPKGDCISEIGDISAYTTSNIVSDYIQIIQSIITEDQFGNRGVNMFYGVDYGAYLLLQLYKTQPSLIDLMSFDSFMYPPIVDYDYNAANAGDELLFNCYFNSICTEEMQAIPGNLAIQYFFSQYVNLTCPTKLYNDDYNQTYYEYHNLTLPSAPLTISDYRIIFRNMAADPTYQSLLLPVISRLLRCNNNDLKYLMGEAASSSSSTSTSTSPSTSPPPLPGLMKFNYQFSGYYEEDFSPILRNQIILNDLFYEESGISQPTEQQLTAISDSLPFSNYQPSFYTSLDAVWSWNSNSDVDYSFISSSDANDPLIAKPILIMSGDLDVITSPQYSELLANNIFATSNNNISSSQYQFAFPLSSHYILGSSIMTNGELCGVKLFSQFALSYLQTGVATISDSTCIAKTLAPDYAATRTSTITASSSTFGSANAWGYGPIPQPYYYTYQSDNVYFSNSQDRPQNIPNLSLNSIIMVDTLDTSQIKNIGGTLTSIMTGELPEPGFFSSNGYCIGCSSDASILSSSLSFVLSILFFLSLLFINN